jgi:hypothetical protein
MKNEKKKKIEIKRVLNSNKINNYIQNSKTNYSNYKRVPHMKSQATPFFPTESKPNTLNNTNNSNNNNILNNQINKEENNNKLWFKTQYNNFNKIDEKDYSISEYNKKNYKNKISKLNNMSSDITNKNINAMLYNRNNNSLFKKHLPQSPLFPSFTDLSLYIGNCLLNSSFILFIISSILFFSASKRTK